MQAPAQKSLSGQRAATGFTLIEVMIVVAIVGILAAIAFPNFSEYLTRGRLTEATATLSAQRVRMEQFYQDNRTYTGACAAGSIAATPAATQYFVFACTPTPDDTSYTITATGQGSMAPVVLSIDQSNTRRTVTPPTGWSAPGGNCWVMRKSGTC